MVLFILFEHIHVLKYFNIVDQYISLTYYIILQMHFQFVINMWLIAQLDIEKINSHEFFNHDPFIFVWRNGHRTQYPLENIKCEKSIFFRNY